MRISLTAARRAVPGHLLKSLIKSGGAFKKESVLTLHRTKKYQDGTGLADYDSTHDYVIGELGFVRIYPGE